MDTIANVTIGSNDGGIQVGDWNPFTQRPPAEIGPALDTEIRPLAEVGRVLTFIAQYLHEVVHIYAAESFLSGQIDYFENEAEFTQYMLGNEAFATWHSEIVVCQKIGRALGDLRLNFNLSSVQNPGFEPLRALELSGLSSHSKSLNFFIDSLLGDVPQELRSSRGRQKKLMLRMLHSVLRGFYVGTIDPLALLHKHYQQTGLLREFYFRYCRVDGIPSLLEVPRNLKQLNNEKEYFKFLIRSMKSLNQLSKLQVLKIKSRRKLQMRAYFALSVRNTLLHHLDISASSKILPKLARNKVIVNIEQYLSELERMLCELGDLRKISQINDFALQIGTLDKAYSTKVAKKLRQYKLRSNGIKIIIEGNNPFVSGANFDASGKGPVGKKELRLIQTYLTRCHLFATYRSDHLSEMIYILHKLKIQKKVNRKKLYNELLMHPKFVNFWSPKLWDFDPMQEKFKEMSFVYH